DGPSAGFPRRHRSLRPGQRTRLERTHSVVVVTPREPQRATSVSRVPDVGDRSRGGARPGDRGRRRLPHLSRTARPEAAAGRPVRGGGHDHARPAVRGVAGRAAHRGHRRHHPGGRTTRKRKEPPPRQGLLTSSGLNPDYIMSGDMPPGIPPPRFSSGTSVTIASVVSTMAAIEAAFWSADRVTLAGSTMPASNMFTNLSLRAS